MGLHRRGTAGHCEFLLFSFLEAGDVFILARTFGTSFSYCHDLVLISRRVMSPC
jgi:hypothetical protein